MKQKVLKYEAVFEEQPDGGYTVIVPQLPGCISEGDRLEEAKKNIAEAITVYLESLIIDGEEIPQPKQDVFVDTIFVRKPVISTASI